MKTKFLTIVLFLFASTNLLIAQSSKPKWEEMKNFHSLMSKTFHPAEEGNLTPLREKADSLYTAAKIWKQSAIPNDFIPKVSIAA